MNNNSNNDPLDYLGLDKKKAALLNEAKKLASGKKSDDMLPLLLAISNKAKKEGIQFTPEEITTIIEYIKKDMPPEDQNKLDTLMRMVGMFR